MRSKTRKEDIWGRTTASTATIIGTWRECVGFDTPKFDPIWVWEEQTRLDNRASRELPPITKPDESLVLIPHPESLQDMKIRAELFQVKIEVNQSLVDAIIDPASFRSLISEEFVKEMAYKLFLTLRPINWGESRKIVEWSFLCSVGSILLSMGNILIKFSVR